MANNSASQHLFSFLLSIGAFIALWSCAAVIADNPLLFPTPLAIVKSLWIHLYSGELLYHLNITLLRVLTAFIISMVIGSIIGCLMGASHTINKFLDPWLILFLNIPALVIMILCYIWVGMTDTAAILAVCINKIPNVAVIMREGTRTLDKNLDEMATVYKLTIKQRFIHLLLPQLTPYLAASSRSGIALIWKIVLVVELLGRSDGMGFQIHLFFQLFDITSLLAYALAFIIVMQSIELLILQPWERHINRWRQP